MDHMLALEVNDTANQFAVYAQYTPDLVCQYIGVTKLIELYQFKDARLNSAWQELAATNPKLLTTLLLLTPDEAKANNFRFDQIRTMKPHCNVFGHLMTSNRYLRCRVRCNETGEIYATAAEAAQLHSVAPSYMYGHLKGNYGHRTIKGRTFSRIDEKDNVIL